MHLSFLACFHIDSLSSVKLFIIHFLLHIFNAFSRFSFPLPSYGPLFLFSASCIDLFSLNLILCLFLRNLSLPSSSFFLFPSFFPHSALFSSLPFFHLSLQANKVIASIPATHREIRKIKAVAKPCVSSGWGSNPSRVKRAWPSS